MDRAAWAGDGGGVQCRSVMRDDFAAQPRALLLDMDGTLTRPTLDFAAIRAEMGIGDQPILEAMATLPPRQRARAEAVLAAHEERAAVASELNDGCASVLGWCAARGVPTALITRNSRWSVDVFLRRHGLRFDLTLSRDDGLLKPDAAPVRHACRRFGVAAREAWMVGDGVHDVEAGLSAGAATVWISHGRPRPFAPEPWRTVAGLGDLLALLGPTSGDGACLTSESA